MSVEYTSIRISKGIAARLEMYRRRLEARKKPDPKLGRSATSVSLAEAIERLLDRNDGHADRSRRSAAKKSRRYLEGQMIFDQCQ